MSSKVGEARGGRTPGRSARPRRPVPRVGGRVSWAGPRLALAVLLAASLLVSGTGLLVSGTIQPHIQSRLHPLRYEAEISGAAAKYGVDPYLVAAVARAESGYDPEVVSPAGAVGLMQIMPATAAWIEEREDWHGGPVGDLTDPALNVQLGAYYLAFLLDLFEGDIRSALAAYNAGQGTVAAWLDGAEGDLGDGTASLDPANIPFPETRGFVERVERFRAIYLQAHPTAFAA